MSTDTRRKILIAEDDVATADIYRRWMEAAGHDVTSVGSAEEAVALLDAGRWDVLVSDIGLPGISGLELVEAARVRDPRLPVLLATAQRSLDLAARAVGSGAGALMLKPFGRGTLLSNVERTTVRDRGVPTVLAIGAHPDDVELGCGGTLLAHRAKGHRIVVLTLSAGGAGGSEAVRERECADAAKVLGAKLHLGCLPDRAIGDGAETINRIEAVIREYTPTWVYTHCADDTHQDHRAVHRSTLVAGREVPNVLCYQSPSSTSDFRPTRFVDVGDTMEGKLSALAAHASQGAVRPYLEPDIIRATARYWGRFAGYRLVEPFIVVREFVNAANAA